MPEQQGNEFGIANATAFVDMLGLDPSLRNSWNAAVEAAKSQNNSAVLNQFLQDNGYDTTTDELKAVLSNPINKDEIPNLDSTLFASQIITNGELRLQWVNLMTKMAEPTNTSPDLKPVEDFLAKNQVNASPMQVARSLASAATTSISQWVGTYGNTTIQQHNTKSNGPTLVVTGDFISLDTHKLVNWNYDSSTATLSWSNDMNDTAGQIVFSVRSNPTGADTYVGNEFSGTLTLPQNTVYPVTGTVNFSGKIGPASTIPPSVSSTDISAIQETSLIVGVIVGTSTILMTGYRFRNFISKKFESVKETYRKWRGQEAEKEFEMQLAKDFPIERVDKFLGEMKLARIAKLKSDFDKLTTAEQLGSKGKDLLEKIDKVRETITDDQIKAIENEREAEFDYIG